ncbi:MAG: hypothetical protein H7A25_07130 [Leptospiraceae bacterium]|nr:hypothetical protein [Leptospiraceae bacterium]
MYYLIFVSFFVLFSCTGKDLKVYKPEEISLQADKVFITGRSLKKEESSKHKKEIDELLNKVLQGVFNKNLNILLELSHPKKGIYVDLKAHWDRKRLETELSSKDSYFETYFFNREKLVAVKQTEDVRTVRELLLYSGGLIIHYYFDGDEACELKLEFKDNKTLAYELNNPYFIRVDGKWYIYRMF